MINKRERQQVHRRVSNRFDVIAKPGRGDDTEDVAQNLWLVDWAMILNEHAFHLAQTAIEIKEDLIFCAFNVKLQEVNVLVCKQAS